MHDFYFCHQLLNPSACPPNDFSTQMPTSLFHEPLPFAKTTGLLCWNEFLVSKQIDSAAYIHILSALFVEVL